MSRETSEGTGKVYGLKRVCDVLQVPRSTVYVNLARQSEPVVTFPLQRRGPKPKISDEQLLEAIRVDLKTSPFTGEGHRKVWRRLQKRGIGGSRARVLRLMRENHLLSPHRKRQGSPNPHDGTIITERPNQMWGTDGIRIETAQDGWVWVFSAVDHYDACCMGIHAVKIGNRFAALEPISQGLLSEFGSTDKSAARGLTLRMDHGTQYAAEDFLNQIRYWGIAPSFAFVAAPQTNGVAERFNRTLKEQVFHGHVYENLQAVQEAVTAFKDLYNNEWLVEKLGHQSPRQARMAYFAKEAA